MCRVVTLRYKYSNFSAYKLHVVEEKVYNDEEYNVFFLSLQGLYVS